MPRNGSGTYTPTAGNPVVTDTTITTAWANALVNDVGNEITASLDRSGRGGMLAPLRLTNGDAAAPSLAFTAEPTTGLFRKSAEVVGLSIGGAEVLEITPTGMTGTASRVTTARVLTGPSADAASVPVVYPQGANSTSPETLPQIRERNLGGAQGGDLGTAPSLAWYWAGVDAGQVRFTPGLFSFLNNAGGFAAVECGSFRGTHANLGRPTEGNGGYVYFMDDGGTFRWSVGYLPGSIGARDWTVYNNVASRTDFRIDTDGNIYGQAGTMTIGGRNASALKLLPSAGVALVSGEVYTAIDGFTVPAGLTLNSIYPIYNDLFENITITPAAGVTLRLAGTLLTGARTLGPKGFASLWVRGTNEYVMTGAGLS